MPMEHKPDFKNGYVNGVVWSKIAGSILLGITIFSTGWAASSTIGLMTTTRIVEAMNKFVDRLDKQGTQKSQELDVRLTKVETILEDNLKSINVTLGQIRQDQIAIKTDLKEHVSEQEHVARKPSS